MPTAFKTYTAREFLDAIVVACEFIQSECSEIAYGSVSRYHRSALWCLANEEGGVNDAWRSLGAVRTNARLYLNADEWSRFELRLA